MKKKKETQMTLQGIQPPVEGAAGSGEPLVKRLLAATRPAMVQVAPGKYVPFKKGANPPSVSMCTWAANGDGTYSALPFTERLARLDHALAAELGFSGQRNTLRRLAKAGFIEVIPVSPGCTLINLDSYYNHLRRVAEKPDAFWERSGKNFKAYKEYLQKEA